MGDLTIDLAWPKMTADASDLEFGVTITPDRKVVTKFGWEWAGVKKVYLDVVGNNPCRQCNDIACGLHWEASLGDVPRAVLSQPMQGDSVASGKAGVTLPNAPSPHMQCSRTESSVDDKSSSQRQSLSGSQ